MVIETTEQELALLYGRARASYARCIGDPENQHLQEEVAIALESIAVRDASVQIKFYERAVADYLIQVELGLFADGSYMGRYAYMEDKMGNAVEDGLVFF